MTLETFGAEGFGGRKSGVEGWEVVALETSPRGGIRETGSVGGIAFVVGAELVESRRSAAVVRVRGCYATDIGLYRCAFWYLRYISSAIDEAGWTPVPLKVFGVWLTLDNSHFIHPACLVMLLVLRKFCVCAPEVLA